MLAEAQSERRGTRVPPQWQLLVGGTKSHFKCHEHSIVGVWQGQLLIFPPRILHTNDHMLHDINDTTTSSSSMIPMAIGHRQHDWTSNRASGAGMTLNVSPSDVIITHLPHLTLQRKGIVYSSSPPCIPSAIIPTTNTTATTTTTTTDETETKTATGGGYQGGGDMATLIYNDRLYLIHHDVIETLDLFTSKWTTHQLLSMRTGCPPVYPLISGFFLVS
jgi:hypothetical protein